MTGPAARPTARPMATGFAAAHFAAAVSRMVSVRLLMPWSSGAGGEHITARRPRWRRSFFLRPYSCCLAGLQTWRRDGAITSARPK